MSEKDMEIGPALEPRCHLHCSTLQTRKRHATNAQKRAAVMHNRHRVTAPMQRVLQPSLPCMQHCGSPQDMVRDLHELAYIGRGASCVVFRGQCTTALGLGAPTTSALQVLCLLHTDPPPLQAHTYTAHHQPIHARASPARRRVAVDRRGVQVHVRPAVSSQCWGAGGAAGARARPPQPGAVLRG